MKVVIFSTLISALISILSAVLLVGHPAHFVQIVGLFGGGFGSGAGVTAAIAKARQASLARPQIVPPAPLAALPPQDRTA